MGMVRPRFGFRGAPGALRWNVVPCEIRPNQTSKMEIRLHEDHAPAPGHRTTRGSEGGTVWLRKSLDRI